MSIDQLSSLLSPFPANRWSRSARTVGRWIGLGASAVLSAGILLIAPSANPAAIPSAAADPCPDVEVIFARGTDEPPGVGRVGDAFVSALRGRTDRSVGVYAVNYPATKNIFAAADGANDASGRVQYMAGACPDTRLVLGGYSQGAAVMDVVTAVPLAGFGFGQPLPAEFANNVAAVAVFGNPSSKIGGPLTALSPLYGYKAIDLCNGGDPICSDGRDVGAHSTYVQSGMANQAANFVAGLV